MIHIRTSLPTATLYIFSFYKQLTNHPVSWFCPDTYQVILTFMWMAGYWFWAIWYWLKQKKIYDNKKTHPSIMFMNVLLAGQQHLLPFYQRFHLGIFFQLWWQNWGLFTPSFFFSMSVSPITIPPFSPSSFQNCAYI